MKQLNWATLGCGVIEKILKLAIRQVIKIYVVYSAQN